jgi:ABC-type nitrate/sulfonate/bicarbonate transport system permease component
VAVAILVGAWQAYIDLAEVSRFVLPSPGEVLSALVDDRGTLWHNLEVTAVEIVCGVALATVVGLAGAVGLHFAGGAVRRGLYPLLVASQAIPTVILAPILVIWLGFGLLPKLIVIALVCFFPILVTTLAGLEAVDRELIKLLRTFDAGRWQIFRRVELPSALPGLFTGVKLAAVFAVIGAVFAEWSGSSAGLGYLLTVTISNLETAETFATVFVLAALAIGLFATFEWVERLTLPWLYRQKDSYTR